jgi:hypothetical protein
MGEQIISASGIQYGLKVNPDGSINVETDEMLPSQGNNPAYQFLYLTSGTATGVTGSVIGSIIQFVGTGSYIQIFTWANNKISNIGSWS